jgi:hypothetical protein
LKSVGNGGTGRGTGLFFHSPGSSSNVATAVIAGLQETPDSIASAASLIFKVANIAGTITERMRISSNGNLGLSTTTPQAAIDIGETCTLRIAGAAGGTGTPAIIDANGDLRPKTSSRKFKHDIQDLDFDTQKLSALRPVQYRLNSDNTTDFGFIAEELHPIFPLAVNLDKEKNPYSVKYGQICVLLTKGWQDHEQKMHAQANTVKSLRDKVAEQDRRIATHEDTIATIRTLLNFSQLENQRIREENRQLKEKQESLDARLRQLEELLGR